MDKDRGASYPEFPVRLPPILPTAMDRSSSSGNIDTTSSDHGRLFPRLSDPYPGMTWSWSQHGKEMEQSRVQGREVTTATTEEATADDRKASMQVSPRSQVFRQLPAREGERIQRVETQSVAKTDTDEETRPAKMSKMSVNDIVND